MFYADHIGLDAVLAGLNKYAAQGNAADFEPAPLLAQLAAEGSSFAAWQGARHGR